MHTNKIELLRKIIDARLTKNELNEVAQKAQAIINNRPQTKSPH